MYYLIYMSAGTKWFNEAELKDILAVSQVNNARDGITGLLLYHAGNFIQLLEGEKATVNQTFARISADERHKGITHIAGGELARRNFAQWAMGFKTIDAASLSTFKPAVNTEGVQSHIAVNLLNAFIKVAKL
jgi:hypothetical protein